MLLLLFNGSPLGGSTAAPATSTGGSPGGGGGASAATEAGAPIETAAAAEGAEGVVAGVLPDGVDRGRWQRLRDRLVAKREYLLHLDGNAYSAGRRVPGPVHVAWSMCDDVSCVR